MFNLEDHYRQMWENALREFSACRFETDRLIDLTEDRRFGLILIARPSPEIITNILDFQEQLKQVEPDQYYYPPDDLHFTIMAIISCRVGVVLDNLDVADYIREISDALAGCYCFTITCSGITAFPGGVLIQGFPQGNMMEKIRNNLRTVFGASNLEHTIDFRYRINTCHSTVVRFKHAPKQPTPLVGELQGFRQRKWGVVNIQNLELVFSDWYQRKKNTAILETFSLPDR